MKNHSYKQYMVAVLLIITAHNYVDRLTLGLLLQDIKVDLSLSDTQLGFLSGIAFFLFYSVMGIPIARWADRGNRVTIITVTTALWSVAVALCGMAGSFAQLLLVRIGVAVGEAGCVPPAHSLIADYFTRAERPRVVAIYKLGIPLSLVVGYFGSGWLNELYGWRVTFMLLGLPGVVLALLARFTLREPRLALPVTATAEHVALIHPTMKEVCATLWANVTFRHLLFAYAAASFFGYGIAQWNPTFFIRSYGLESGELGTWFAIILGGGGLIGTFAGGVLASRYAANNEGLQLKAMAAMNCSFGLISMCMYLSTSPHVAFTLMGVAFIGSSAVLGPLFATIQTLVPDRMRAMSIAILFLFANLIGTGLGPLTAGVLSDAFRPWAGDESLRYVLLLLSPGYVWAAWHLWRASRTVARDLAAVQSSRFMDDREEGSSFQSPAAVQGALLKPACRSS